MPSPRKVSPAPSLSASTSVLKERSMVNLPVRQSRAWSLQPLGGLLHQTQVSEFVDVEARPHEAEIVGEVDIALQRREVGQQVAVAVVVLVGVDPTEPLGRLLGDAGANRRHLL